jgi:uncharacterized membrane protein
MLVSWKFLGKVQLCGMALAVGYVISWMLVVPLVGQDSSFRNLFPADDWAFSIGSTVMLVVLTAVYLLFGWTLIYD